MSVANLQGRVDELVEQSSQELAQHRRHLHRHPELSNREQNTAAYLIDQLRRIGVDEIRSGLAGHGVIAVIRGQRLSTEQPDRIIALRADMDGLPVREATGLEYASTITTTDDEGATVPVAHACGHDCHMAVVLMAARILTSVRAELPGTVLCVFQPAEEGPPLNEEGGAQALIDSGAFDGIKPTMVFGMHVSPLPRGFVGYRAGAQFAASTRVEITFEGVPTHAAMPWLGKDPLLAAASTLVAAQGLTRHIPATQPATVTFGHLEDRGRYNTIGGVARLHGTIRCSDDSDMDLLKSRLGAVAEGQATSHGCTARVRFVQDVPALINHQSWIDAAMPTLRRALPDGHLVDAPQTLGYDDVSALVRRFGGLYLLYGVQDTQAAPGKPGTFEAVSGGRGLVPNPCVSG